MHGGNRSSSIPASRRDCMPASPARLPETHAVVQEKTLFKCFTAIRSIGKWFLGLISIKTKLIKTFLEPIDQSWETKKHNWSTFLSGRRSPMLRKSSPPTSPERLPSALQARPSRLRRAGASSMTPSFDLRLARPFQVHVSYHSLLFYDN